MIYDLRPRFIVTPGQPTSYGGATVNLIRAPGEFIPRIPRNPNMEPRPSRPARDPLHTPFGMERR